MGRATEQGEYVGDPGRDGISPIEDPKGSVTNPVRIVVSRQGLLKTCNLFEFSLNSYSPKYHCLNLEKSHFSSWIKMHY